LSYQSCSIENNIYTRRRKANDEYSSGHRLRRFPNACFNLRPCAPSSSAITRRLRLRSSRRHGRRRVRVQRLPTAVAVLALSVGGYFVFFHHKPKLTDKDTIVLADFANSTGDPIFDDTLRTALAVSLQQSPFLSVLPDSTVASTLQLMTRPVGTKLTTEVTRELCQRAGSKAYIAGSIGSLGSEYVVGLKAVNCQSGDTLAQEQVTAASKEKVLEALTEAASKLRSELGESLATVQKFDVRLAQITTPSLEALKAYTLGGQVEERKGSAAALLYYQRAIELDLNFAMAYIVAGNDYYNL
jgi:eukaryotic-like serine/threonine-protein kinase